MTEAKNGNDNQPPEGREDRAPVHGRLPARFSDRERRIELRQQESIIERFRKAGLEAGAALNVIRSQRLYRGMRIEDVEVHTFPQYCRLRWGFDGSRGRQLIKASRDAKTVHAETGIEALNESQLRPLGRLLGAQDEGTRNLAMAIWRTANLDGPATETTIKRAMREQIPVETSGEVTPVNMAALLDHAYECMSQLVDQMGRTDYRQGLTPEQRASLKEAVR